MPIDVNGEIVSLLEDYALEFQNATQAAQAQLNP
jgi:hypothetical protein